MDRTGKIAEIVKSVLQKATPPDRDESLFDAGHLDSFALPDMITELEREFQINIPDSDLDTRTFDSVARIDQYVDRALAERAK